MTQTREAIERLQAGIRSVFSTHRQALESGNAASDQLLEQLGVLDKAPAVPAPDRLHELRRRLANCKNVAEFDLLKRRDIRDAIWILWNGQPRGASLRGLVEAVARKATGSRRLTLTMIDAWFRDFSAGDPQIAEGAKHIRTLLKASKDLKLAHWQELHRVFDIFSSEKGPNNLAVSLLTGTDSVRAMLERWGFGGHDRAASGYVSAILDAVLLRTADALRSPAGDVRMQRIQTLLEMQGADGNYLWPQQRFDSSARYLLAPWLDGKAEPHDSVRESVRVFLLERLGDPWSSAKRWVLAGEDASALMKRWLTQISLKVFFELIREQALDKHWRYREAFWTACLEHGAIKEAWLVLGSHTRYTAASIKDMRGTYGSLQEADASQSVLLLRVGSLVLCEWSHNGSLRAWLATARGTPELRLRRYFSSDLRRASLPFPPSNLSKGADAGPGLHHKGSEVGRWQSVAARLIAEQTNIHLTYKDWMP